MSRARKERGKDIKLKVIRDNVEGREVVIIKREWDVKYKNNIVREDLIRTKRNRGSSLIKICISNRRFELRTKSEKWRKLVSYQRV